MGHVGVGRRAELVQQLLELGPQAHVPAPAPHGNGGTPQEAARRLAGKYTGTIFGQLFQTA